MHRTIYIDIDEEITSVVDRLNKTEAGEVIIVIPKRALMIQSIVNLRILKREAERRGKRIMIVTQDKLGKSLIEKAGIMVQQHLEEVAYEDDYYEDHDDHDNLVFEDDGLAVPGDPGFKPKIINGLGSDDYFALEQDGAGQNENEKSPVQEEAENLINKELVVDVGQDIKKKKSYLDGAKRRKLSEIVPEEEAPIRYAQAPPASRESFGKKRTIRTGNAERLESFFNQPQNHFHEREVETDQGKFKKKKELKIPSKFWKIFMIFGIVLLIGIASAAAYLIIPRATVHVVVKAESHSADIEVRGNTSITSSDLDREIIPARIVSIEDEITRNFDATGAKSLSNQKAKGLVTIYNEFSSSPQPLVATTRFESEGGKIFRLSKGVSIPGTTQVGTETKPGVIEAEVVADQSGDEYNIAPSKFTIPGFKSSGNDKFAKIYASSSKPMIGGGKGQEETKVLTDFDIENAKKNINNELIELIRGKIKGIAGEDSVTLDENISFEESTYKLSSNSGEITNVFSVSEKIKAKAIVFKESDLQIIASRVLARNQKGNANLGGDSISFQYGKADSDFNSGQTIVRARATGKVYPEIDVEALRKGILGKNNEGLKEYLAGFDSIESVEVTYQPSFISNRIPIYEKRVEIILDKK